MIQRAFRILGITALASASACSSAVGVPPFPDFGPAARVVVTSGGDTLAILTHPADSARIAALVAFANARNDHWERPWYGVPVPRVTAYFFGGEFQGSFGAGRSFFETQRADTFASRAATPAEVAEFARIVGVPVERVAGERR